MVKARKRLKFEFKNSVKVNLERGGKATHLKRQSLWLLLTRYPNIIQLSNIGTNYSLILLHLLQTTLKHWWDHPQRIFKRSHHTSTSTSLTTFVKPTIKPVWEKQRPSAGKWLRKESEFTGKKRLKNFSLFREITLRKSTRRSIWEARSWRNALCESYQAPKPRTRAELTYFSPRTHLTNSLCTTGVHCRRIYRRTLAKVAIVFLLPFWITSHTNTHDFKTLEFHFFF